ncbi:LacI family DNA-binding transcriptional regulator [Actinoallomurus purpureus]|uniref:LacI family DNA-binding transcriptional regulator n=1 Tax=Actinoallomurus purpureus TaxID=478114 RepID=UPI002092A489|nr:LacI family DNA-binding transcriptional regulator [Actinoallomurus purpureus]MCO6008977.1 LacI family DNA-binding transcriptional regulator [Actinoallomurus purpureus]
MERVTLQTIADRVGVSRTTVSNAFSRPDQLNEELRRRILEVAGELGYPGPHPAARTLRRGRAGVIGVVFTETLSYAFADSYAVGFLRGLASVAEQSGTGVHLIGWPSPDLAEEVIGDAVVDGFCLFSPEGHPLVETVLRRRLPVVTVDYPYVEGVPFVGIEDRAAARRAAEHVLGLGHRRVAVLGVQPVVGRTNRDWLDLDRPGDLRFGAGRARLAGYRDACEDAGLEWKDVVLDRTANDRELARRAAARLLDADPRPTAVLAPTDEVAFAVLDVAAQRGIEVPRELSVIGFDDVPAAAPAGLTTVRQPITEKGTTAGRLLVEPPRGEAAPCVIMPTELVVRRTTAPPPDAGA